MGVDILVGRAPFMSATNYRGINSTAHRKPEDYLPPVLEISKQHTGRISVLLFIPQDLRINFYLAPFLIDLHTTEA